MKHTNLIERIQRRATRLKCGTDQPATKKGFGSSSGRLLSYVARKYLYLVQLYKIMFRLCDIDRSKYLDIIEESRTRSNHKYKLRPKHARTNYFKFSFFNRYISDWNSLPYDVVEATSLATFKSKLMSILLSRQI